MSGFVVDSRTLVAVRDTLGRLNDQLVGMHTVIWHQWGTLGGSALESELEHFCGTWHYGVTELGGQLADLTRRLGEAAAAYDRIEQRITHASGGSGSTGGAPIAPTTASGHTSMHHTAKHTPAKHTPAKHTSSGAHHTAAKHPGVGSGTTVIGGGGTGGGRDSGRHHPSSGSGSGTTIIGGGPTQSSSSGSGSGTTTIDEKIHRAEEHQRDELAAVLKLVKD
ncbi:MAG TPA: hypothetical protein VGG07_00060 [Solirubrobacteraceae bacterium]|jgi:hypothetical protein|nr:hypothetical protein [Solirubrobacteraceae bacterium]